MGTQRSAYVDGPDPGTTAGSDAQPHEPDGFVAMASPVQERSTETIRPSVPIRGQGLSAPPARRFSRAVAVVTATAAVALLVIHNQQAVFWPLLMALAIAYMLEPVVARLQRAGMGRTTAVGIVFCGAGAVIVGIVAVLTVQGVRLAEQLRDPERGLPAAVERFDAWLLNTMPWVHSNLAARLGGAPVVPDEGMYGPAVPTVDSGQLQSFALEAAGLFGSVMETLAGGLGVISMLVLVPIYLVYLMAALPRIWVGIRTHLPASDRNRTLRVLHRVHTGMAAFLRGRVVIALLKGAVTAVGLAIVGIPLAGVIGLLSGLASVLPYIGPLLGLVAALGVTIGELGVQTDMVLGVVVVFTLAEVLEGLWFVPWIMKEGVQLHPLVVIFCVVFWGSALGIFGVFIAIPLTLVLRILYEEYVHPSVRRLADGSAS